MNQRLLNGFAKEFLNMFFFALLFFVLIPLGRPGTAGSPFRFIFVLYDNMGLSFYEFFGFLYILILLVGAYLWIVRA